jgi:NAD(P) transhydrogenase subunit beta
MTSDAEIGLYIFILAGFLGFHVISRVPPLLHTPLMSATNALSGISLIGSLVVAGSGRGTLSTLLGTIAVICSATNVVGGFLITDRMLRMFRTERDHQARPSWLSRHWRVILVPVAAVVALVALLMRFEAVRGIAAEEVLRYLYILSGVLFILGLKGLSSPRHARQGMCLAEFGMLIAVVGTLFHDDIRTSGYAWIAGGLGVGCLIGAAIGLRIPMTAVPQRTALSHALGALAAVLVGIAEYVRRREDLGSMVMTPLGFQAMIGSLTFTGSLLAAGKLHGILPQAPITYRGQYAFNLTLLAVVGLVFLFLILTPSTSALFFALVVLALLFGFLLVVPIGAADMPVVIALLNSYGGLADAAMGFVLANKIQIITGSLDGSSGFLLSLLMCRAMNRSAWNVLFGAFGKIEKEPQGPATGAKGTVRSITPEEVVGLLDGAWSVIIAPGYGMAVAHAQHSVSDLARALMKRGIDVKYAIHPVAGRMPGHMNVLLAEADIPYEQLYEMEQINPHFPEADLALVIGANDVTNPAAKHDKASPLFGMPILEVDRARSVVVLKRSLAPGFAGVDNELYYNPKCMMLFGDARESLNKLLSVLK